MKREKTGIIMLLLVCSVYAFSTTHVVCAAGTGDFIEIQEAVNAASQGDKIVVKPGTYQPFSVGSGRDNLVIQGSGADQTFVYSTGVGNAANVTTSSGVIIEGFTLSSQYDDIVYVNSANGFIIRNCVLRDSFFSAIRFWQSVGSANYFITNCIFINNTTCITSGRYAASRVPICYSSNNIFINNGSVNVPGSVGDIIPDFNLYWNNTSNGILGDNDFIANPMFEDIDYNNYHLQTGSPAINAGTPGEICFNVDGSRNSLGIYGGPHAYPGQGAKINDFVVSPNRTTTNQPVSIIGTSKTR